MFQYLSILKTDSGPVAFQMFCKTFHTSLTTGISYNPQGQKIVEGIHYTLKIQRQKQKGESFPTKHHTS